MKLFWKSQDNKAFAAAQKREKDALTAAMRKNNALHDWWYSNCEGPVPPALENAVSLMTKTELEQLKQKAYQLSANEQARIEETRRLACTKRQDIEQSIQTVEQQQEWLKKFRCIMQEYDEHRTQMYDCLKHLNSLSSEEQALERFEAFERIQGRFLRMQILLDQSRQLKDTLSTLLREADEQGRLEHESSKRCTQAVAEKAETEVAFARAQEQFGDACKLEGVRDTLRLTDTKCQDLLSIVEERLVQQREEYEEITRTAEASQASLNELKVQVQTLMPHQKMVEHPELIIAKLDRLDEISIELEKLKESYNKSVENQRIENELLGKVYSQYQTVDNDVRTLKDELTMHRHNNAGHVGYALQERAMLLKTRQHKLLSARFMWKRIMEGYVLIAEKEQLTNSLRLNINSVHRDIELLEPEVISLRNRCHDKEYTLTLGKSQNVIQLRNDLQEGIACTVCGATHHPYHADTMQDQSKLLGDIRIEFEMLSHELQHKDARLQELRQQHHELTIRLEMENASLEYAKKRQDADAAAWQSFADLDRSFADCNASTNLEARMTLIQQLIESTAIEEQNAQTDLDAYNFHQARIVEISDILDQQEQRRQELTVRLNELNTGVQVMAGRSDRLSLRHNKVQSAFSQLFDQLNNMITISDWFSDWKENQESLKARITNMSQQWAQTQATLSLAEADLQNCMAYKEKSYAHLQALEKLAQVISEDHLKFTNLSNETQLSLSQIVDQQDPRSYIARFEEQYRQACKEENDVQTLDSQQRTTHAHTLGEIKTIEDLIAQLDAESVKVRSDLDIWIRQYNATHPPVQYSELERIFAEERDWTETRAIVRKVQTSTTMEQEKVNELQSKILSLKADNINNITPDGETEQRLASQLISLQHQLNAVLMQIAELDFLIKKHNDAEQLSQEQI
ncbi:MAG: hypothetical protein HUK02_04955 [Bacteroidaceae bacterium]|nr:hypothetical protein [Bacteroidaceae bacterium]